MNESKVNRYNRFEKGLHKEYGYYSSGKWLHHCDRVKYIKEHKYYDVMPVTAQVAPTLLCNFSCPRCSYGGSKLNIASSLHQRNISMNKENLFKIVQRLSEANVKGLVFTGGGEPMLNPFLIDGMDFAVKMGLKIGLFTNGSMLTKDNISVLLDLNPSFIRISLDAGSSEIHRLIHGYPNGKEYFSQILESLEILAKEKITRKSDTTIGIGVSVEPLNLNDLTNIANELNKIDTKAPFGGIDYLVFRPVVNYRCGGFRYYIKPAFDFLEKTMPEYANNFHDYVDKGIQYPGELFIRANEIIDSQVCEILRDSSIQVINIHTKMLGVSSAKKPFSKCRASAWYIFVGPDGTVYNCVELGLDSKVAIGNLLEFPLSDIWKNERRKQVIDYINDEGINILCPPVCLYYEMNSLFQQFDDEPSYVSSNWIEQQEERIHSKELAGSILQPHVEFI